MRVVNQRGEGGGGGDQHAERLGRTREGPARAHAVIQCSLSGDEALLVPSSPLGKC